MKFEFFIGLRYFYSRKANQFISRISLISIITVCLAIMVPTLVLSVMNGFHASVTNKIIGSSFHLQMKDKYENFQNYREIKEELKKMPEVNLVTAFFEAQGLIKHYNEVYGTVIKGIDDEEILNNKYFNENYKIVIGDSSKEPVFRDFYIPQEDVILVGEALANQLSLFIGESVDIMIPSSDIDISQDNLRSLRFAGKFTAGYAEYDKNLVFLKFSSARNIFGFKDIATGLGIVLNDENNINSFIQRMQQKYPDYILENTLEQSLFKDFQKERNLMQYLLYFLIIAAFMTIYITIHVVVMDKRREVGIIKAFGGSNQNILLIFIMVGLIIAIIGCFLGTIAGLLVTVSLTEIVHAWEFIINNAIFPLIILIKDILLNVFNYDWLINLPDQYAIMPKEVFYLQTFPYKFTFIDIFIQNIGAIIISLLASYFPAKQAISQKPAEVLRYD